MPNGADSLADLRRLAAVRETVRSWRALTGGRRTRDPDRRTLVACSGGADSSALGLALASASRDLVVGHVVHDMRPHAEARADADAVIALARRLGLPYAEGTAHARSAGGNLEGQARRLRYLELATLALRHDCGFIATAHHADDQLETLLMRLMRGAGPKGLGGAAPRRSSSRAGITIVRPMLGVSRRQAEEVCLAADWEWRSDPTNLDPSRLRSALRLRVIPVLRELAPGVERRASRAAGIMRDAAAAISDRADELAAEGRADRLTPVREFRWPRETLRAQRAVVLGELFRAVYTRLQGEGGLDRRTGGLIDQTVRAVRSPQTDPKVIDWGPVRLEIKAATVRALLKDKEIPDADHDA